MDLGPLLADAEVGGRMRRARRWAAGRPAACAAAASLLLLCVVAALTPTVVAHEAGRPRAVVTTGVLLLIFAVAQACVVDIEFRRQTRSVSLSEIPFLLGLLCLSPMSFLAARVLGGFASQVAVRRQHRQPLKLLFNTSLMGAEAVLGLAVFEALRGGASSTDPRGWTAAVGGTLAANAFGAIAVESLLNLIDVPRGPRDLAGAVVSALPQAMAVSSLAVLISLSLTVSAWAALPVVGVAAILVLGYGAYAELRARHEALGRLYTFSHEVTKHPDTDLVLPTVLRQLQDMLRAEHAFVTLFDEDGSEVSSAGDAVRWHPPRYVDSSFALSTGLLAERATPLLMTRSSHEPSHVAWRRALGLREAAVVPLRSEGQTIGALGVADRLGEARGFTQLDIQLLETVAAQVVTALRNGQLLDRLRHDALHDPLTQLPNRGHMEQILERLLNGATAATSSFAVALIGLGSFKEVNDSLGHQVGDDVLRAVAERLSSTVREHDTVARLGGDEFVLVLPHTATADEALAACERAQLALAVPVTVGAFTVDVSAAVGFVMVPEQAGTATQVLRHADLALTAARRAGREVLQFQREHDQGLTHRLELVAALREALTQDRLALYIQPQVDVVTGAVVGVEALSRWHDPVHGTVPPDLFVALAERSGMMHTLTAQVLEKAIRSCAAWQPMAPGIGIAVNLSARSLLDRELLPQIDRLLAAHRLPPSLLTLEITESSVMSDSTASIQVLQQCRQRGLQLSVDDFGTGYSSLSYLRRLPVQEVKIDKSFVLDVDHDVEDATIVRSIVELGHALGLRIVAEGVERPDAMAALQTMGCDLAQGYAIAHPMPVGDFASWYRDYRRVSVVAG
ncbi:MAG: Diguanylate cyclase/phosphodiesterase [Frankiales bacterium]|nr:Diguanylate cyclase/phosphodiesterase [Frankiales bacterium]